MREFQSYVEEGKVKEQSANHGEARSLRVQAVTRFEQQIQNKEITPENSTFIFEDAYESLRQYLQSFMAEKGYKPYSHEAIIAYASREEKLSESESNKMNQFRKLRNDITYRGETSTEAKAKEMKQMARKKLPVD